MAIYQSIRELIGQTPLLEIKQFPLPEGVRLFAKLEFFNPGGSVKDRLGVELIEDAFKRGKLKPGGTIIEPTAGNTGIGLALAAKEKDVNVIFCVPEHFSKEKQIIMQALGAKIVHTPQEAGMVGAIQKTEELVNEIPNSFSPQQFANPANPRTYYKTLAPEIWDDLGGHIDIFVAGAGSAGTFMGCSTYFKEKNPSIRTVIVEPEGSIIAGGEPGPHRTEGIGMEFFPSYMKKEYIDQVHTVSDGNAFQMVEELAEKEGLLIGSSSGSAMFAALSEAKKASAGTNIVTVFPDGSDRYLSKKIYPEV
ncbi:pyridoxal-phosphate dependent enzyme [Ornithinibacillus sp. L9]|uniref:Pyridoxal-phosphate dependent enzyme n=1 Tax=Ornithinibacillus caprae TaxID=2678566 RepID=A0A6N8FGI6_9BACI|nr:cysteine synthase family protein [Ornithinibacillus caprae]MUK88782.1 pyridoxal-phosphate dependent enzyme [Ornithinibacillus caprae]